MLNDTVFHRLFSMTMYKNKTIPLGEMSFSKDFIQTNRGDLYPILCKSNDCVESINNSKYYLSKGTVKRFVSRFFPFATYKVDFCNINGEIGFEFDINIAKARITFCDEKLCLNTANQSITKSCPKINSLIISCRPGAFDIFHQINSDIKFLHTFECEDFINSNDYNFFHCASASLYVSGQVEITNVETYIDCGISQADMRPIRYENGDVITENGNIYLTMSIRMQKHMYQGIFSWTPGTADFKLTGALFFDNGDGKWCGDVASSILYNRNDNMWYLWVASFNHGHILGHSKFKGEIRYGINVVDITLMEQKDTSTYFDFCARAHDEDPDFFYSEKNKKWYMAICRKDPSINSYRYAFFESQTPFDGYTFIGSGNDGAETGGSFVRVKDKRYFICGNDFNKTSDYRIYSKDGITNASFDYPDGGFRGWGTLIPIELGSRTRYFWLTFDRHNGSDFNWSYGNIYCFEGNI